MKNDLANGVERGKKSMAIDHAKAIKALRQELERITAAMMSLEAFSRSQPQVAQMPGREKRGRKSMGAAERLEVAARMRKYWARRRQEREQAGS